MILDDHMNWMFDNPLIGINDEKLGPRFPDLSAPYCPALIEKALQVARQNDFVAHRGVYAALTGPTYETRSEYRMLRKLGADAAGMSTVPEVLVAIHGGVRVFALSVITNACKPDVLTPTHGEEVVEAAQRAEQKMRLIVRGIVDYWGHDSVPRPQISKTR
jgi:purine-nucleoside phosphorylase